MNKLEGEVSVIKQRLQRLVELDDLKIATDLQIRLNTQFKKDILDLESGLFECNLFFNFVVRVINHRNEILPVIFPNLVEQSN